MGTMQQTARGQTEPRAARGSVCTLCAYVERGCRSCAHALELVDRIRREYPSLNVEVIDVGVSSDQLPEGVFAVPTLVLDGEVIALGTPSWEGVASQIDARLAAVRR